MDYIFTIKSAPNISIEEAQKLLALFSGKCTITIRGEAMKISSQELYNKCINNKEGRRLIDAVTLYPNGFSIFDAMPPEA